MYNTKDIVFAGKHDYDKDEALKYATNSNCKSFSVGVFKWELKSNGKEMKKGRVIVRVSGLTTQVNQVMWMSENVVKLLDEGMWDGRKTVVIK